MIDRFCDKLQKRLTDLMDTHATSLAEGKAQDMEDYRERCGKIRAYREMVLMIGEVRQEVLSGEGTKRSAA